MYFHHTDNSCCLEFKVSVSQQLCSKVCCALLCTLKAWMEIFLISWLNSSFWPRISEE